ncbi:ABC transporter permease [Kineococcus sp. SYSU DK001]|uniref:ABC transporter permease n=1 Tax=Kineococcus sp. SYSU DK001 TaxID=3383122 RepID=UPI003D7D0773
MNDTTHLSPARVRPEQREHRRPPGAAGGSALHVSVRRAVGNEFAKMRRLRVAPVTALMVLGVVVLSCVELVSPTFADAAADPQGRAWERLLLGMSTAIPLVSPVLIAVLASRQVDVEHQGRGWMLSHGAGLAPGRLCRAKLLANGSVLAAATGVQSVLVAATGFAVGIAAPFPVALWLAYSGCVLAVNLVLLALHLLLAARWENQLIGTGLGLLGVFLAVIGSGAPRALAHLTPWGYYALSAPVDYRDAVLVDVAPSYGGVAALTVAAAAAFALLTARLDRKEI